MTFCFTCKTQLEAKDPKICCPFCNSSFCAKCIRNSGDISKITCSFCLHQIDVPQSIRDLNRSRLSVPNCTHLVDVRVIQRELVYIVGIPIQFANEEALLKYEFFGQYGPIKKVAINASHIHSSPNQVPSISAYITFRNCDDALECIYALENFSLDGNPLKASFGTTKYCSAFLRGQKCTNPDCMYLHHSGDQNDSFSKDEITGSCLRFVEMTRPLRPADYDDYLKQDSRQTVLPPRRILKRGAAVIKPQSPKKTKRNSFIELLSESLHDDLGPIIIDDHPNISLEQQLGLKPISFRDIFTTFLIEKYRENE